MTRDIELILPAKVYEKLMKLSDSIDITLSEAVETICARVFDSRYVMGEIGMFFKKSLIVEKTFYMGCSVLRFKPSRVDEKLRVNINVPDHLFRSLDAISYSLDSSISDAIVLILEFFLGERKAFYSTERISQIKYIK